VAILRSALVLFALLSATTGLLYPALVTVLGRALFSPRTEVRLVYEGERAVGSALVGQGFASPRYFWSRPSAVGYNAATSSGTNQGPMNPALRDAVQARVDALRAADPGNQAPVPVDLVTSSGSGLDPHISPAAALYQVPRVARARGLPEEQVRRLAEARVEERWLGFLGERRVNVLLLNLDLDRAGAAGE
jgi:K+-transporting ATPase ATPase C chain